MGKTFGEVVKEYFPDATDDEVDFILCEKTGYPCFWETMDTEACLRKQLEELKKGKEITNDTKGNSGLVIKSQ